MREELGDSTERLTELRAELVQLREAYGLRAVSALLLSPLWGIGFLAPVLLLGVILSVAVDRWMPQHFERYFQGVWGLCCFALCLPLLLTLFDILKGRRAIRRKTLELRRLEGGEG